MPGVGRTEVAVDTGAEESVCPWGFGEAFGISKGQKQLQLLDASGNTIKHHGERVVNVKALF